MSSTDQEPKNQRQRIDSLLLMIGGLEEAILNAMEQQDWEFVEKLKKLRYEYHERLRRVAYGLPERNQQTKE